MHANSSPVTSAQTGIHHQLSAIVAKHARSSFKKPIMAYNRTAFDTAMAAWRDAGSKPLILDSGCGVGLSTMHLAAQFPDHFVIGVDQSADRLTRKTAWRGTPPSNFILARADLIDFWRLMQVAEIYPARHYLFYPNPWPKIGQLARRWHGHPVFPTIVALGGVLECRSNWQIYIDELAAALTQLTATDVKCERYIADHAITPFEQKYTASGHQLWRCQIHLDRNT